MTAPPVLAAAIIPSHSARDDAIGFSTRTWTPARAAAIVGAAWQGWGVQTQSACTRARSTISATSGKALTPYRSAKAPRRSEGRLQNATNSDSDRSRADADPLPAGPVNHFRHVGEGPHAVPVGKGAQTLRRPAADGDKLRFRESPERRGMQVGHLARADQGRPKLFHGDIAIAQPSAAFRASRAPSSAPFPGRAGGRTIPLPPQGAGSH